MLTGNVAIKDFAMGDIPFGSVTQAHVESDIGNTKVDLTDVRATKGKSTYEMATGRLDFAKPAKMVLEAQISSRALNVRDFFSMFHLDDDPRLEQLDGMLSTDARMRLVLGGPEDKCDGGFLTVVAQTDGRDLNVLGEHFDEGHVDMEYRWDDRLAGLEGAEIDIQSMSLTKIKKEGRAPLGSILGSVAIHKGGDMRGSVVVQGFPLQRTDLLGHASDLVEGSVSGVGRIGGTITAFEIAGDASVSPLRFLGAPFGASDLHFTANQIDKPSKPIGKTKCGAPIYAPFDKNTYLADTSSAGDYKLSGSLFGGQIKLTDIDVTRQKSPLITGGIAFDKFDLGPVGKILASSDPNEPNPVAIGGEISGNLSLDKIEMADLGHARVRFAPTTLRIDRGGQHLELRDKTKIFELKDDTMKIPSVTFDLAAPNGLKGSVAVDGEIARILHGGKLDLKATLSPIDLGILVGVVPRLMHSEGQLSGSVQLRGTPAEPILDGRLAVRGGEFGFRGLPGGLTDVNVDVEADANEARITNAHGHFLGGEIGLTAQLEIEHYALVRLRARERRPRTRVRDTSGNRARRARAPGSPGAGRRSALASGFLEAQATFKRSCSW